MSAPELNLLGQAVMGLIFQWVLFGPKKVPSWLAYGTIAVSGVLVCIWVTPTIAQVFADNWRSGVAIIVSFLLAVRGAAGGAKDARMAPKTDSL